MEHDNNGIIHLKIPSNLKAWLRAYARRQDLSMTTVIRFLLEHERAQDKASKNGKSIILPRIYA